MTNMQLLQDSLTKAITAYNTMMANPRPDGAGDGSAIQWTGLRKSLLEEIKSLREQINMEDAPYEIVSAPGDGFVQ